MWLKPGRKISTDTGPSTTKILELADKDFNADIINMFKDLKKNLNKMRREMEDTKQPERSSKVKKYNIWNEKFPQWD